MKIRDHFRAHGGIHAFWIFSILSLVIVALLLRSPNGNAINDYISFASSIASLILAIVAIFYSIISNQAFSETVGSLKTSTEDIQIAARNMADTSAALNNQSEKLIGEVARVPSAVQALSEKVDAKFAQAQTATSDISTVTSGEILSGSDDALRIYSNTTFGGALVFYIISLSNKTGKPFDPNKMFDKINGRDVWINFVMGYLQAVKTWKPAGVQLGFEYTDQNPIFSVLSIGDVPQDEIISRFASAYPDNQQRGAVDTYFN